MKIREKSGKKVMKLRLDYRVRKEQISKELAELNTEPWQQMIIFWKHELLLFQERTQNEIENFQKWVSIWNAKTHEMYYIKRRKIIYFVRWKIFLFHAGERKVTTSNVTNPHSLFEIYKIWNNETIQ